MVRHAGKIRRCKGARPMLLRPWVDFRGIILTAEVASVRVTL